VAAELFGEEVAQGILLGMEYDRPSVAPPRVLAAVRERLAALTAASLG
jgi:hypothetical protein